MAFCVAIFKLPVIVSPAFNTSSDAEPVIFKVAAPEPSRLTIVLVLLALVASVPNVISFVLLVTVT